MRWLFIIWLLLLSSSNFYAVYSLNRDIHAVAPKFEERQELLSQLKYTGQEAEVFDQFKEAHAELQRILFSKFIKVYNIILVVIGLMAVFSTTLLVMRRGFGIKLGLITLVLFIALRFYSAFSKESSRKEIGSDLKTMYQSVSILTKEKFEMSPEDQKFLKPQLAASLSFCVIDLLFFVILFLKRKTIIVKKPIPVEGSGLSS